MIKEALVNVVRLVKWGNGQGVRLSKSVIDDAGLSVGDDLSVRVENGSVVLTPVRRRVIGIPDFEGMFAGYRGGPVAEDGFASPVGEELL